MTDDDGNTALTAHAPAPQRASEPRTLLVLYYREGGAAFPLESGRALVVGRTAPADVVVPDQSLSRNHARFTLAETGVWVEDLGSTNGTYVAGRRIERALVQVGDEVVMGAIVATIAQTDAGATAVEPVEGHDTFELWLEGAVASARTSRAPFGVVMLRSDRHASHWLPLVRSRVKTGRIALYGPRWVVAGIPGATLDRLGKLASAFEEGPGLLAGIASFPETAHSADELVEVARRHCFRATASAPVRGGRTDTTSDDSGGVVLASSRMRELMAQVERVAPSKACVLVIGETGSGKEVVARAIHAQSPRKNRAFRAVNCGAIPENLVEATLFGHERGAFTGADRRAAGAFEQADQGTLFLDEIGELGLSAQAALLRVLETGTITPIGSASERKVDVRVVAATHRDLEALTRRGDFREDLMFRLDVLRLDVPPLRERAEDIEALAIHFLDRSNQDGTAEARSLSPEALAVLKTYAWPGNVRELRNAIERAALLATSDVIAVTDLPARVRGSRLPHQARSADLDSDDDLIYKERVRRFETDLITEALDACDWNQTEAAKRLKIPIRTLTDKMRQLGLRSRRKE